MDSKSRLKIGIIGLGFAGSTHARALQSVKGAELAAVADIFSEKAEKLASEYNITSHADPDSIINDPGIDIVDICLPTTLHKEYTLKAAGNKKHVFCEKPVARTLEDAKEMIDACRNAGVRFMVGHVLRFFPEFVKIKEQIDKGMVGKVGVVRTSRLSEFPVGSANWYSDFEKSGGLVLDMIAHDFDWLRWCFGEVKRVYARGLVYTRLTSVQLIDYALVTLRFKNGVIAHTEGSWAETGEFRTAVEVCGEKGIIDFKSEESVPMNLSLRKKEVKEQGVSIPESPTFEDPYALELQHFVDSINKNRDPNIVTSKDAYKALEVALAVLESIKTGEVVNL